MALDFSGMNNAQVEAYLRDLYAQGAGSIATQSLGDGIYRYTDSQGRDYQPYGDGWARQLTPNYDPAGGGQFGGYYGTFDPSGQLQDVRFQQADRHDGYLAENPAVAAALMAAAFGGIGMLANGSLAGGAAGAGAGGGFNAAAAGTNAAMDAIGGAGIGTGAGTGGGAAMGTLGSGTSFLGETALADTLLTGGAGGMGAGGALSLSGSLAPVGTTIAGGAAGLGGAAGAGGFLDALGGAKTLASLGGALAGASGSGPGTTSATSTIPEWALPFAQNLAAKANNQLNQQYTPYGGQLVADLSGDQLNAAQMARDRAANGSPEFAAGSTYLQSLLSGNQTYTPGQTERTSNDYLGRTSAGASNGYIGQSSGSIAGVGSIADQIGAGVNNPYIGATTGPAASAGRNALLGLNNPYLQSAIDQAQQDTVRNYNLTTAPMFDARERASGSFGNTGVEQARAESQRALAGELGKISTNMRMQDYNLQAGLGESDLNRTQGLNQFNASLQAGDLARNLAGFQAQGFGNQSARLGALSQDAANALGTQQFNANLGAQDLARNASLTQGLGQFNASLGAQDLARNASLAANQGQFNANQGNLDIANSMNAWNANQGRMSSLVPQAQAFGNQAYTDANALNAFGTQVRNQWQDTLNANYGQWQNAQAYPWQNMQQAGNVLGSAINGQRTTTQQTPGTNPVAGALGGALAGAQTYSLLTGNGSGLLPRTWGF